MTLPNPIYPETHGAKGDGKRFLSGGVIGSGTTSFFCADASFTAADVSKAITIQTAGGGGLPLSTTIAAFVSSTIIELADAAVFGPTSAEFLYGTDDTDAIDLADAERLARSPGASVIFQGGIYCARNLRIRSRPPGTSVPDSWACEGTAHLACIGGGDTSYFVASERWIDGASTLAGWSNSPMRMQGIHFDAQGLADWAYVAKGYMLHHHGCSATGGRIGWAKLTRQNQVNDVVTITGDVTVGSDVISNAVFVSSTGSVMASIEDVRAGLMVDGPGFVASATNRPFVLLATTDALTMSQPSDVTSVGATFRINLNASSNRYQSGCKFIDFDMSGARGTYGFLNEGTVLNPADASTDGKLIDYEFNGMDVVSYGVWMGNCGGWEIASGHTYSSLVNDLYVHRIGYDHNIHDNDFEDHCCIVEVGRSNALGGGNNFRQGLTVRFANDGSTENLFIPNARFTQFRGGGPYAQLTVDTLWPNKSVDLSQPHFRAGLAANGTPPIVRVVSGTITVTSGRDADGAMDLRYWGDDTNEGPWLATRRTRAGTGAIGGVRHMSKNSVGVDKEFAAELAFVWNATAGAETGYRVFYNTINGVRVRVGMVSQGWGIGNATDPGLGSMNVAGSYYVGGVKVLGARGAAVPNPAGGGVVDAEARAAVIAILDRWRAHGGIAP